MKNTLKNELLTIGILAIFIFLFFGKITDFQFQDIDIPLHDTYWIINIPILMFISFLSIVMIVFGFKQFELKFKEKSSIIILLINNSAMILAVGFFLYLLFGSFALFLLIDVFFDSFLTDKTASSMENGLEFMIWGAPVIMLLFVAFEFFLISRLWKINRQRI